MENIKPCPFCGSEAKIVKTCDYEGYIERWEISCTNERCRASIAGEGSENLPTEISKEDKESLITAWNNRT